MSWWSITFIPVVVIFVTSVVADVLDERYRCGRGRLRIWIRIPKALQTASIAYVGWWGYFWMVLYAGK